MRRLREAIKRPLYDERGSMTFVMTALIMMAVIIVLPLVWNTGAIRAVRRQSQNSSDAAALAGAESVARRLNSLSQDWWGCIPPETPKSIVGRYVGTVVTPIAGSNIGLGAAQSYAAQNRGSLSAYSQHLHPMGADGVHAKMVDGVVVPPIHVDLRSSSQVRGAMELAVYNVNGLPVRSSATAEVYLDRVRTWQTPCPYNPEAIARHYQFRWKIRMVRTGW
jgi:hypothetical protein